MYNLDPNNAAGGTSQKSKIAENWPQWTSKDRTLINFFANYNDYIKDDFRSGRNLAEHIGDVQGQRGHPRVPQDRSVGIFQHRDLFGAHVGKCFVQLQEATQTVCLGKVVQVSVTVHGQGNLAVVAKRGDGDRT